MESCVHHPWALTPAFFSPTVLSGFCGPGAEHSAHAHLRLDPCLRGEPLQVLPASHLHAHAAGALRRHPGQKSVPPALLKPQTRQDPEGLGEGQCCQVHTANGPQPGPEDEPRVRSPPRLAPETRCRALSLPGILFLIVQYDVMCANWWFKVQIPGMQMYSIIFRTTHMCV